MARNTFTRGSSTYPCNVCGRLTRFTGAQAYGSALCGQCWDIAGIYNEFQDYGPAEIIPQAATIRALCAEIVEKGGKLDGDALELLAICNEAEGGGKPDDDGEAYLRMAGC